MKFHEKLKMQVQELGLNKSKAARAVGLPESTISNYLASDKSLPRIDIAVKIAKAIRVPVQWLIDDEQAWPPPVLGPDPVSSIPDSTLLKELAKRLRHEQRDLLDYLEQAATMDWSALYAKIGTEQWNLTPGSPEEQADVVLFSLVMDVVEISRMNVDAVARSLHDTLPGSDLPPDRYDQLWPELKSFSTAPGVRKTMEKFFTPSLLKIFYDTLNRQLANLKTPGTVAPLDHFPAVFPNDAGPPAKPSRPPGAKGIKKL